MLSIMAINEKIDIDISYKHSLKQSYNYLVCKPCKRDNNNYNYTLFMLAMTTNFMI